MVEEGGKHRLRNLGEPDGAAGGNRGSARINGTPALLERWPGGIRLIHGRAVMLAATAAAGGKSGIRFGGKQSGADQREAEKRHQQGCRRSPHSLPF